MTTRYPTHTYRDVGAIGATDQYGIRDLEVNVQTTLDTPFSDPQNHVGIAGREDCCGHIPYHTMTPAEARELAAVLVQAADEAEK